MKKKTLKTTGLKNLYKKTSQKNKAIGFQLGTEITTDAKVITKGSGGHINEGLPQKTYWNS